MTAGPMGRWRSSQVVSRRRSVRGKRRSSFMLAHPVCAGVDVGSASHFVSVPPDLDAQPVRELKSFTNDLNGWLIGWPRAGLRRL